MQIILQITMMAVFGLLLKLTTEAPTWACVGFAISWSLMLELIGILNQIHKWLDEE